MNCEYKFVVKWCKGVALAGGSGNRFMEIHRFSLYTQLIGINLQLSAFTMSIAQKGVVCVWQTDARGGLNPIRQYRKKGSISALIYCVLQPKIPEFSANNSNTAGSGGGGAAGSKALGAGGGGKSDPSSTAAVTAKAQNQTPSFFFGTDRGAVVFADDLGHCTDVQQLSAPIDTMLYFEERSRLVIITRSLLLTQYHVSDDGRVARVAQVKLSVPQDVAVKGIQSIVWAGPGLLAAATEEKIVRLFDLAADESYNLSMNNALGKLMDRADRVVCVAFSPVDRYLAVGTQMGIVAVWKFTGQSRDVSGSGGAAAQQQGAAGGSGKGSSGGNAAAGAAGASSSPPPASTVAADWEVRVVGLSYVQ